MLAQLRVPFLALLVSFGFLAGNSSGQKQPEIQGQRVLTVSHSFHAFMPGILADIAKGAGIKEHKQVGSHYIGGSRVIQHWTTQGAVGKESNDVPLPTATIHLAQEASFAPSGEIVIQTSDGDAVVRYTGRKGKTFTGCTGGKGTLTAGKKVSQEENAARQTLKAGKVDVLTMSPVWLPDDGIENFVKLGLATNPEIRVFVQQNWLPWDHYDAKLKPVVGGSDLTMPDGKAIANLRPFTPTAGSKHNAATGASLRKMHEPYFKEFDDHVAGLNKKFKTKAVRIAPVGQAVIVLREKIIAGQAPGLKEQNDLFSDPLGHGKAPLMTLAGYVYYAAIYERSPVGLPVPAALAKAPEAEKLNRLLQEIAWQAVTEHPLTGVKEAAKR